MKTLFLNNENITEAANILKNNGVGIFPTDTVYGIGCNCFNEIAIKQLFEIKKRNLNKPICILASNIEMVKKCVKNINPIEQKLIENFWPGKLTIIFDKTSIIPNLLTSGLPTVGIRIPNNNICINLINKLGIPIATSSANISNEKPYASITKNLLNNFENKVDFIINSDTLYKDIPSTIVRVEKNKINILREGEISLKNIMEVI